MRPSSPGLVQYSPLLGLNKLYIVFYYLEVVQGYIFRLVSGKVGWQEAS